MDIFCEFKFIIKLVKKIFALAFVSQLFGFLVSMLELCHGDLLFDELHHKLLFFTDAPPLLA